MRLVLVVLAVLAPAAVLACSGGAGQLGTLSKSDGGTDAAPVGDDASPPGDDAGDDSAAEAAGQDAASDAGAADVDDAGQLPDADAGSPPDAASSTECAIYTNEPGIQCQAYPIGTGPYAAQACRNPPYNMPPYEDYAVCPPSCTPPAIWAQYSTYNGDPAYCVPKCADADAGCAM